MKIFYDNFLRVFFGLSFLIILWSGFDNYSFANWVAEIIPVMGALILLWWVGRKKRFYWASYLFLLFWIVLHTIGAKYSFALVPLDFFEFLGRNQFDRIAHFSIGFWAIFATEWAWKEKSIKNVWLAMFFGFVCVLALAGAYEIIEWWYAVSFGGEQASDFLGSQGDIWDAQKDMLMDSLGAIFSLAFWRIFIYPRLGR